MSGRPKYTHVGHQYSSLVQSLKYLYQQVLIKFQKIIIQVEGSKVLCEIHKLINSIWNKQGLPQPQKELTTVPIYKKGKNRQ